jgi:cobalt-zinc-cadmium efflux system membrane fusion protein
MKTLKHLLFLAATSSLLLACGSSPEVALQESDLVEITNQQFTTAAMELGQVESRQFENVIKCSGYIVPLPSGKATLTAPVMGVIKSIYSHIGQQIEKNQPVIEIAGNEIIDLQREFAQSSANYSRLQREYERVKSLYNEKVTAEKDFIATEAEFIAAGAIYTALKLKIEALGFSTGKIENGEFYSSYVVKSPISGVVANLQVSIGDNVDPQVDLLEIVNPQMLQVKLAVFASDIANLKKGQMVRYKSVNSSHIHHATISSIGVTLDESTKTVACYAAIEHNNQKKPLANEFVESEIVTSTFTAEAIPKESLVKSENGYYVFALSKKEDNSYFFNKKEVRIGRESKDFVEIIDNSITGTILTRGSYNISSAE